MREFILRPPFMSGHDLGFLGSPSVARQTGVRGSDEEIPLVCHDVLTVRELQQNLSATNLPTDILDADAGLFREFADRRLFERFPVLDTAAWRSPVILAGEWPIFVDKAEQQDLSGRVHDEKSSRRARTHAAVIARTRQFGRYQSVAARKSRQPCRM